MVLFTIVTLSNGETIYFDQPLPKPKYVRLLGCSLYNSWNNLKLKGDLSYTDGESEVDRVTLSPGFYTIDNLASELSSGFDSKNGLKIKKNSPSGGLVIKFYYDTIIEQDLSELLGLGRENKRVPPSATLTVSKLNSPSTYFIHCDLLDREQNLYNGKPSSLLALFNIKGQAYEKN